MWAEGCQLQLALMAPGCHQGAGPSCVAHPASPKSAVWGWPWELGLETVIAQAQLQAKGGLQCRDGDGPLQQGAAWSSGQAVADSWRAGPEMSVRRLRSLAGGRPRRAES